MSSTTPLSMITRGIRRDTLGVPRRNVLMITETCPDVGTTMTELLRDEHAAVYAYGVLGARLGTDDRRIALAAFAAHRAARDQLRARLLAATLDAPGPEAAYDVSVAGPSDALALAVRVEEQLAVRWRDLVALSAALDVRRFAVRNLQDCAVRAALWRRVSGTTPTVAFPGQA
jgi:hypothetical protein